MDDAYDIGMVEPCGCQVWLPPPGTTARDELWGDAILCASHVSKAVVAIAVTAAEE